MFSVVIVSVLEGTQGLMLASRALEPFYWPPFSFLEKDFHKITQQTTP
jgi:hypothetical protein